MAGLQKEVKGLAETVQRLSSENETLRTQSTAGAVRTVTMANGCKAEQADSLQRS